MKKKVDPKVFRELVAGGLSDAQIARYFGCSRERCRQIRKQLELPSTMETARTHATPEIEAWHAALLNDRELGELHGMSRSRAREIRIRHGLPRPNHQYPLKVRCRARAALSLYRRGWTYDEIGEWLGGGEWKLPKVNAYETMNRYLEIVGEPWPERLPVPIGRRTERPEMDRHLFAGVN